MLLFHADSNPFVLIVEVFLAFIGPYPALLLNIARSPSISRNMARDTRDKWIG